MPPNYTKLEPETREEIDEKLEAVGWVIQDKKKTNLMAGNYGVNGVAIREMDTDTGPADYMLFIAGKACGIVEAKQKLGHPLFISSIHAPVKGATVIFQQFKYGIRDISKLPVRQ